MPKKSEDVEEIVEVEEQIVEEKPTLPKMDKVFKQKEVQNWLENASVRLRNPKWMNVKLEEGAVSPEKALYVLNYIGKTVHRSGALFVPAGFEEASNILAVRGFQFEGDVEGFMKFVREYIY